MKPRITVITLAVSDLERSLVFYRDGLGLATSGITGTKYPIGACVFFNLEGGLKLALWPRSSLVADTGLPPDGPAATEVLIAHNVGSVSHMYMYIQAACATYWRRPRLQAGASSSRHSPPSGAATAATSRIWMVTCGRWCSTPTSRCWGEGT